MRRTLSAEFIHDNPHLRQPEPAWGFYIIRPGGLADDAHWALAMTRLRECILEPFHDGDGEDSETSEGPSNADLTRLITDTLMMPVLDLPWPSQTAHHQPSMTMARPCPLMQSARDIFAEYVDQYEKEIEDRDFTRLDSVRRTGCILIDDTTLEELTVAAAGSVLKDLRVIIVDPDDQSLEEYVYTGWMYAKASRLLNLYQDLKSFFVSGWCPHPRFQGQLPVYTAIPKGELIDPPEGLGPALGGTTLGRG